ncbi:MAG: hypothetical protein IPM57_06210 [Oligoflexia bacterium]|nr:hypothetical protein [Oligoflexia bacterium]
MDRSKISVNVLLLFFSFTLSANEAVFKFSVKTEPQLDPARSTSGVSHYIHSTLYSGLTRYTSEGMVVFDSAKSCRYITETEIKCKLKKDLKFHDGSPVLAKDFVESFLNYLKTGSAIHLAQILFSIKNAKNYYLTKAPINEVGIKALNEHEIQFLLEEPDREFLDKLSHPLLIPYSEGKKFNGPYYLDQIDKGKKWTLRPNKYFDNDSTSQPNIEIYFVNDESTTINLFDKGKLDFVWRLPSDFINRYKQNPAFTQIPVARFDYIGFNQNKNRFFEDIKNRKTFSEAIDYKDSEKIHQARGRFGCPGLGPTFIKNLEPLCVNKSETEKIESKNLKLNFYFSALGGDDILKQAGWFQNQWKQNLKLDIKLRAMEQKTFIKELANNTPDVFRKGISLAWPSCYAALMNFKSDSPENFTGFKSKEFDEMIKPLKFKKLSTYEKNVICAESIKFLFKRNYVGIPLGLIHFSMLINPKFKNVNINDLNQLDLRELKYVQ